MQVKNITITFEDFLSLDELTADDSALCNEAESALKNSHSPYSGYRVGAAVRLQSGRIVHGCNQENVAYPSGLCAERVALFTVGAQYPDDPIQAIAITANTDKFIIEKPVTPCGACLQVMSDFEQRQNTPIRVLMYCSGKNILIARGLNSFLPFQFVENRLSK